MSVESMAWFVDDTALRAIEIAAGTLQGQAPIEALTRYYSPSGGYAGALFTGLLPNDPLRVTPTDLLAVTTLSIKIMPRSIRRITSPAGTEQLRELLSVPCRV